MDDNRFHDVLSSVPLAFLALEARLIENSTLFQDFERMLPRCYECYMPNQPLPPDIREAAARAGPVLNQREATSDGN